MGFDGGALFDALDRRRRADELSWLQVASQIWEMSAVLNAHRADHPISSSTITNLGRRGDTSCQHALFMLRWLDRLPEDFVTKPRPGTTGVSLPSADSAHRLRWDLVALHAALDEDRRDRGETWKVSAERLRCTDNQLTGLRTVKFAISMRLTMRICQALGQPAASFVYVATW